MPGIKMGICGICAMGGGVRLGEGWVYHVDRGTHLHAARKNSRDQLSVPALENQSLRSNSFIIPVQMTKEGCATRKFLISH